MSVRVRANIDIRCYCVFMLCYVHLIQWERASVNTLLCFYFAYVFLCVHCLADTVI